MGGSAAVSSGPPKLSAIAPPKSVTTGAVVPGGRVVSPARRGGQGPGAGGGMLAGVGRGLDAVARGVVGYFVLLENGVTRRRGSFRPRHGRDPAATIARSSSFQRSIGPFEFLAWMSLSIGQSILALRLVI
jgi:hypothetical protein